MLDFIIIGIVASVTVIVAYYKWIFKYYWTKRNLPNIGQPKIPSGSLRIFPLIYMGTSLKMDYDKGKSLGYKHGGLFQFCKPIYMAIDPEFIKNILQRGFNQFNERGFYHNEKDDPISANLFAIGGEKWHFIRRKLSPVFTPSKIRMMFDNLVQCSYQMQDAVNQLCKNKQIVDIKEVAERFTMDVIGSCAFGLECNCFKNPDAEFRKQGRKIFHLHPLRVIKTFFVFTFQDLARWLGIKLFEKETNDFFMDMVEETMKFRQASNFVRNDFLQILLELANESESTARLSIEEMTAHVFIFFAAGFETSSTTLSFCLYELAENQDVQGRVRDEINKTLLKYDGKITYDAIMDMKYMNQVVEETLRKYPAVSFITRVSTEDYPVPDTETVIEKGIMCYIPILGVHRDPEYYPDPDKFDPERFSEENKQKRRPFTYIPFGEGPRICIGLRFGLMQVKVGLTVLLQRYKFLVNTKTVIPFEMEPYSFTMIPKDGIFLDVEKVSN